MQINVLNVSVKQFYSSMYRALCVVPYTQVGNFSALYGQ